MRHPCTSLQYTQPASHASTRESTTDLYEHSTVDAGRCLVLSYYQVGYEKALPRGTLLGSLVPGTVPSTGKGSTRYPCHWLVPVPVLEYEGTRLLIVYD